MELTVLIGNFCCFPMRTIEADIPETLDLKFTTTFQTFFHRTIWSRHSLFLMLEKKVVVNNFDTHALTVKTLTLGLLNRANDDALASSPIGISSLC